MEGQQIGSYKIERKLGEGGMGVVWVGVDVRLGRRAAIKQLLPEMSGNRDFVERFFNEAKAAASINHPGIVEIYDVGWHVDGSAYFAMKLLQGDSLARRVRDGGPMSVVVAATVARQVASALSAAHARGIVHRDLKPDNVVLVPDEEMSIGERATVLDFGIAKLFGDAAMSPKTRTGMVMGTPSYMSPEQCRGAGEVDVRADVYALGCILFEMLTGRPPFEGEGVGEVLGMHQFVEPPTVRSLRADVPAAFEAVVMRALAKRPEERQQTMGELTAELHPFATARPSVERPAPSAAPDAATIAVHGSQVPASTAPASQPQAARPQTARPHEPTTLSAGRGEVAGVTAAAGAGRRRMLLGLGAGAVVAAAAVIAIVLSSGGEGKTSTAAADLTDAAELAPVADAAVALAESIDAAAPAPVDVPTPSAESLRHDEFVKAIESRDYRTAQRLFGSFALGSEYKQGALTHLTALHEELLAEHKIEAKALARAGKCAELHVLADEAATVSADIARAVRAVRCKRRASPALPDAGTSPPAEPAPNPAAKSPRETLDDALLSFRMGSYDSALHRAETVLAMPGADAAVRSNAAKLAAMSACSLKDAAKGKRHAARVPESQRGTVRQLCAANGISVD